MSTESQETVVAIGLRVREMRKLRGWSQETLAEHAALPVEMVSRAENARVVPSLGTLQSLCSGLGVGLADLVDPGRPLPAEGLTVEESALLRTWRRLGPKSRRHLAGLLEDLVPRDR